MSSVDQRWCLGLAAAAALGLAAGDVAAGDEAGGEREVVAIGSMAELAEVDPGADVEVVFTEDAAPVAFLALASASGDQEAEQATIEVRIENGKISAKVNGKPVKADSLSVKDGRIVIRTDDGEVIDLATMVAEPMKDAMQSIRIDVKRLLDEAKVDERFVREDVLRKLRDLKVGEMIAPGLGAGHAGPSAVMGVELREPDEAVLRHLRIAPGTASEIVAVIEGSGAAEAGLESLDIIVEVQGASSGAADDIRAALAEREAGDTVEVVVIREGDRLSRKVELQAYRPRALEMVEIAPGVEWRFGDDEAEFFFAPGEGMDLRGLVERRRGGEDGEDEAQVFVMPRRPGPGMQWRERPGASMEDRISKLEDRLDRLTEKLEKLVEKLER